MSPKKTAIGLLTILVICIIIIFSVMFYLIIGEQKSENTNNTETSESNNFTEYNNFSVENDLVEEKVELSEEFLSAYPDIDFNVTGTDWSYEDEDDNVIIKTKPEPIKPEKWEDTVTQEDIDSYKFKIIYNNMPEEISGYINKSFEDFDKSLKEYSYLKGFAAANEAKYEYYRTINSGQTIMIYFILNDYYKSEIGVLINLDDFSSNIFNAN